LKILFRTPNWIGDAIVSRILLYNLKGHEITLLCRYGLQDIFYDFECITFKNKKELFLKSLALKKRQFDVGIVVPLSFSSAFFLYIAHPAERIGFSFEKRDIFLTKRLKIPDNWKNRHTIQTQFLLLKELGIEPEVPEVYFSPVCNCDSTLYKLSSYVTIAPFAAFGGAKEWFFDNYLEVAETLFKKYGYKTVILGSQKDAHRLKDFYLPEFITSLIGRTSLMEAACIIKNSLIFIGNDSGLAHLSASMGHPTVSIFGPTSPIWTKPIGKASFALWEPPECAPCYRRECPLGTKECMKKISTTLVLDTIDEILKKV